MAEENDVLRAAIDQLIICLRTADDIVGGVRDEVLEDAAAWIRRRLLRDQPMFLPAFMASNF